MSASATTEDAAVSAVSPTTEDGAVSSLARRADELFTAHIHAIRSRVDRLMAILMAGQWVFAVVIAVTYSPYAWEGKSRSVNPHVWAAVVLGGLLSSLPIALALLRPGAVSTRHVIAVAQMLWSALLIHLTGGRIETHFHVFGSLAFLAFYRDPLVLVPATVVVAADHVVRQVFWPESVFGITNPEWWRFAEHAFWVVFEDVFLVTACLRGIAELRDIAAKRAELEEVSAAERRKSVELDAALRDALAAKEVAERANQVKSQFLANMSHELRTPINGVLGMTELVRATEVTGKQRHYLDTIARSGGMLLAVVNDILDFSRVEAGKLELDSVELAPAAVVHAVTDLLGSQANAKGVELLCDVPRALPPVMGDPPRLQQVLNNLVSNAVKFTSKGEVVVRVRVAEESAADVVMRFEVRDTGIGIGEVDRLKIFQPFMQVDGSNSRKYGGTGLGLAIAAQLVQMMDGEMGVDSVPGKGSTFWFTARFAKQLVATEQAPLPRIHCRVLVVDDNATNRTILEEQLTGAVDAVDCADCGATALGMMLTAASEGRPYGLVVTDMQMPGMDGLELARALRSLDGYADVPLVLLSSAGPVALSDAPAAAGMSACLVKPVDGRKLLACLAAVLERGESAPDAPGPAGAPLTATARRSSRPRVLVAEDNPVNREIATEMLEQLGVEVDVAADGREALEVLARSAYAVVLMDCQMPEVDGYEATRRIREKEAASGGRRTPVVAVTAHVMAGERERALAAGMDDYLSKPFTRDQLARAVLRWVEEGRREAKPVSAAADAPGIAGAHALDPAVRRSKKVIELCLVQLPQSVSTMRDAIGKHDLPRLKAEAHKLKGSCLSIGAPRLAELCMRIEAAPEGASGFLTSAEAEFAQVDRALRRELVTNVAPGARGDATHG